MLVEFVLHGFDRRINRRERGTRRVGILFRPGCDCRRGLLLDPDGAKRHAAFIVCGVLFALMDRIAALPRLMQIRSPG